MRKTPYILLILTGVAFVAAAWYSLSRRVVRGEEYSLYSSYRSDRTGTRRLFLFYEDAGLEPVRLKRELLMLEECGLLLIIEPQRAQLPVAVGVGPLVTGMFFPREIESIIAWVSEGNSLVLVCSRQNELHERLGIGVEPGSPGRTRHARRIQLSNLTKSVGRIAGRRDSRLILTEPSWVELFAIPAPLHGEPLVQVAVRSVGEGTVVAISDPFLLTNKGVMTHENLAFAARLAGLGRGGAIYFDEYHHGFSDPRTIISYVRQRKLHFALLQVVVIFGLLVWRGRSRLGRARRLERSSERGSTEYVRAFSLIYRRAHLHTNLIRSVYGLFCEKVALRTGVARDSEPKKIYQALKGNNEKAASRFMAVSTRASTGAASAGDAEVLTFTRMVARFEKEFLDAGRRVKKVT
jgi:hypothetical protein